ncbi:MAG: SPFH domain-containing protein, partial [Halobacteriales archaeon]
MDAGPIRSLLNRVGGLLIALVIGVAAANIFLGTSIGVSIPTISPFAIVAVLLLGLAIVTVNAMVEIVNAYEKRALTVLGEYRKLLEPGINFVPPFVSRTYTFDMRTQTIDVPRQEAITRDNSPVTA